MYQAHDFTPYIVEGAIKSIRKLYTRLSFIILFKYYSLFDEILRLIERYVPAFYDINLIRYTYLQCGHRCCTS